MKRKHVSILLIIALLIPVAAVLHIFTGVYDLNFDVLIKSLSDFDPANSAEVIMREIRIPRMITAIIAGGALSIAGLLMQTLFQNPLAGPYVLGINSGASLFVAIATMTGLSFITSQYGLIFNALLGAFLFGIVILLFSRFSKNQITLLLTGIMIGSFTSAFIAILQQMSHMQDLKRFTLWGLGSLQKVQLSDTPILLAFFAVGIIFSLISVRSLNILVLGFQEAKLHGINTARLKYGLIGITALLAGIVTAYCGPIAFVGLAVPNIVRIVFKTQEHKTLILGSVICGALFLLLSDLIVLLLENHVLIPINAITSIIGAPIVVFILFKRLK